MASKSDPPAGRAGKRPPPDFQVVKSEAGFVVVRSVDGAQVDGPFDRRDLAQARADKRAIRDRSYLEHLRRVG